MVEAAIVGIHFPVQPHEVVVVSHAAKRGGSIPAHVHDLTTALDVRGGVPART
jgi:hypothetical protein